MTELQVIRRGTPPVIEGVVLEDGTEIKNHTEAFRHEKGFPVYIEIYDDTDIRISRNQADSSNFDRKVNLRELQEYIDENVLTPKSQDE